MVHTQISAKSNAKALCKILLSHALVFLYNPLGIIFGKIHLETLNNKIMKSIKLLSLLGIILAFTSCEAVKQATNTTTGAVFSLNGQWQLSSSSPENTLLNSIVTVSPFSDGRLTYVANNSQCYRENDVKWKNIKSDNAGGYTINNLISNCTSGSLDYKPATISVANNNEIRLTGINAAGQTNTQSWTRVK